MTINERFEKIIRLIYAGNKSAFAKAIGVTPSVVENIVGKRQGNPSFDVLEKVSAIAQINIEWLITGEGDMFKADETKDVPHTHVGHQETKPRIPFEAAAGSLSIITDAISESRCERFPVIPNFPSYDFTIIVKGNSMEPEFHSGDEVACRFIDQPSFIQWGRPHVLDTMQGVVLKRIYNRENSILCKSDNKDYEEFEIPKDEILHVALVVGAIRLF